MFHVILLDKTCLCLNTDKLYNSSDVIMETLAKETLCLNSCSKKTNTFEKKLSVLKQVKCCCAILPISINLETGPFFMPNVPCSLYSLEFVQNSFIQDFLKFPIISNYLAF